MTATVIIGLQFGDEGKGKFVDYLSQNSDIVVRTNGGNNAGHTIFVKNYKFSFSMLPCGALNEKEVLIAQGCVLNLQILINEIKLIKDLNKNLRLRIDPRCHIIMPYHILLDEATENYKGDKKMGSLKLGVGYCYEDKTNRSGIRIIDLLNKYIFIDKIDSVWEIKKSRILEGYKHPFNLDKDKIIKEYLDYAEQLKEYILPVTEYLLDNINKKNITLETSQASYLDYSYGTYPYTVAYNTISSAALVDIGLPPMELTVLGVIRAYCIRVGNGPFPTQQDNEVGEYLREKGNEYGTVSKRPRRCGWLDLKLVKYSCKLNGVNELALTKLDILSGLNKIKVCVGYKENNEEIKNFNPSLHSLDRVEPIYVELDGWEEDITKIKEYVDLPTNCKKYLDFIEKYLNRKIKYISVGPNRNQVIINKL